MGALHAKAVIRPMSHDDYSAVMDLWMRTARRGDGLCLRDADSPENIRRFLDRNPGMSFVAELNGRIVGAVLCGHDGRRGYLHHLAVDVASRRHGIGRDMVAACERALLDAGILKCHLLVRVENTDGIAFWNRLCWSGRDDCDLMSKSLTGNPSA